MDITHLKYFVEVANHKSFTKAARTLHVSQPSLSKSIKLLEEEWQCDLFNRRSHHITLTDAGTAILPQVEMLVSQFDKLQQQMGKLQDIEEGSLSLGIPPMVGTSFLSPILREFIERYPKISLKVTENGSKFIAKQVESGFLNVGFVALPVDLGDNPAIKAHIFNHQPLHLLVSPSSHLASRTEVTLQDIAEEPLIYYQESFSLYEAVLGWFQQAGIRPRIVAQSNNWDFITEMVKNKLGVALLPECICQRLDPKEITIIPIKPAINWVLAMIWNDRNMMYPPIRLWVNYCRDCIPSLQDHYGSGAMETQDLLKKASEHVVPPADLKGKQEFADM